MVANQSAPWFEQRSSSKFWWLGNVNYVNFTEEYVMCIKNVLVKKAVYKWDKYGFVTMSLS